MEKYTTVKEVASTILRYLMSSTNNYKLDHNTTTEDLVGGARSHNIPIRHATHQLQLIIALSLLH